MVWIVFITTLTSVFFHSSALWADEDNIVPNITTQENQPEEVVAGCEKQEIDIAKYGLKAFQNPPSVHSKNGILKTTLTVQYGHNKIAGCNTRLRSYNGKLVGQTLVAKPGDTLLITLKNNLPPHENSIPGNHDNMNMPNNFNVTNLHTHGLHVSPSGNSDNVLLKIYPGEEQDYEIKIPENHPAGSFWYHAHIHGSTAMQVASGMAGMLIVEDEIDDYIRTKAITSQKLIFQHIPYSEKGEIENYENIGPNIWWKIKRKILVNGQIVPIFTMRPQEVQRWRLLHAGLRYGLRLRIEGSDKKIATKLQEFATDGLTTGRIDAWDNLQLHPGYRSDVFIQAPTKEGVYDLIDTQRQGREPRPERGYNKRLLARIIVSGEAMEAKVPSNAEMKQFKETKNFTRSERENLPLTATPMVFNLWDDASGVTHFNINGRSFSKDHVRKLKLGRAEKWILESKGLAPAHPFHIHVNPFQMTRVGPNGNLQTVWKDTVIVQRDIPQIIYTRYEDFTGKFVLHCHILEHEDHGMMELLEIEP